MYKTLLIGESSVGKSSLILRLSENQFQEGFISTIGVCTLIPRLTVCANSKVDFKIKEFDVNGDRVKLQIWV